MLNGSSRVEIHKWNEMKWNTSVLFVFFCSNSCPSSALSSSLSSSVISLSLSASAFRSEVRVHTSWVAPGCCRTPEVCWGRSPLLMWTAGQCLSLCQRGELDPFLAVSPKEYHHVKPAESMFQNWCLYYAHKDMYSTFKKHLFHILIYSISVFAGLFL